MENELMTVKEFAQAAGVTMQALYQAFNKQLKPYSITVDGKKMIDSRALLDLYGKSEEYVKEIISGKSPYEIEQGLVKEKNELDKALINSLESENQKNQAFIKDLEKQIEEDNHQIMAKDSEIKKLKSENEALNTVIDDLKSKIEQLRTELSDCRKEADISNIKLKATEERLQDKSRTEEYLKSENISLMAALNHQQELHRADQKKLEQLETSVEQPFTNPESTALSSDEAKKQEERPLTFWERLFGRTR